ncbi:hypothetical protein EZV62_010846 [Acer yangbiense]|uniref:Uncharacterized protein n=1 Tax=Acer yangbiense TaxID=1000413 RepID=A0A5C7I5P6_9ROSI|nr:hypothetical protein EZV62_010846 [Acer yangbiense]
MEVNLGSLPFGLDFHPSDQLVAAALITGDFQLYLSIFSLQLTNFTLSFFFHITYNVFISSYSYRYSADATPLKLLDVHAHDDSCRAVRFINGGKAIVTGSSDHSILATDVETGSPIARLENSHEDAIYSLINVTESTIASGGDEGCIKVWDTRQRTLCSSFNAHEDYVSDMTFVSDAMKLLGTSGDGTLSVCNLRKNTVQTRSEFSEEELTSVVLMKGLFSADRNYLRNYLATKRQSRGKDTSAKLPAAPIAPRKNGRILTGCNKERCRPEDGRKVVCGSQSGTLLLYSWGYFKDCSDRFTGFSPNSVDVLLKLDEDRIITGSDNGLISLAGILPNRIIQPIAEHSEFSIEGLGLSHDRKFLGSISHDLKLKLWDLDDILQGSKLTVSQADAPDSDSDEMDVDNKGATNKGASKGHAVSSSNSFFADL